jgi:hypothetical protein
MPLIIKAAGQRLYPRGQTQLFGAQDWQYIQDRAENANLFTTSFNEPRLANGSPYLPALRDEFLVYKTEADYTSDTRWFGGLITNITDNTIQKSGLTYIAQYQIEASAFDIILDKEIRQPQKAGMTWETLIQFLLGTHFSDQLSSDYSQINNPSPAPPIRINNGTVRTLLKAMRQLTGADYFVDAYKRLHVFQAETRPAGFEVNDQPASGITAWEERPTLTHDGRDIFNIVRQPFQALVGANDWPGESFTGQGDPTGQGGALPLLRTPASITDSTFLEDKFDGDTFNAALWIESDVTTTQHPDFPNQGYLFPAEGQCQLVGGTGTLGGVALQSQDFYTFTEAAYLVQEFQLTNATGEGYIALFLDADGNFKAGLHIVDGALKALDDTVLIASLGTTDNYIFWISQTVTGWQYDVLGGNYATKQTLRTETATHETDYKIAPVINKSLQGSINSARLRTSDRGVILEINGQKKVVGLEASDTDLPDIDAFLNVDETPALLKFRASDNLALLASTSSPTQFTVAAGQGTRFKTGQRLLIIDSIVQSTNGRAAIVESVSTDTITLVSPGISDLSTGQEILINTTVPAKGDKITVRYAYQKDDEAVAYDQASIERYGSYPITLDEKDHIQRFDDAQTEAENYLARYKDGLLKIEFASNNKLIPEPQTMTAVNVSLVKRPEPVNRVLILQRLEITPIGGTHWAYKLTLESADPITPFDDQFTNHSLVIGSDGAIRLALGLAEEIAADSEDIDFHAVTSLYITWDNPENRRYGEFYWQP